MPGDFALAVKGFPSWFKLKYHSLPKLRRILYYMIQRIFASLLCKSKKSLTYVFFFF